MGVEVDNCNGLFVDLIQSPKGGESDAVVST